MQKETNKNTMDKYIEDFPKHLSEAIKICENTEFNDFGKQFDNVLICGLGGSGIAGTIVNNLLEDHLDLPLLSIKDYFIPKYVGPKTLVVVCSYSGNTEETISCYNECISKKAEICILTSGGYLKNEQKTHNYNAIIIPPNNPPRSMIGYSLVGLLYILYKYKLISDFFKKEIKSSIRLLNSERSSIQKKAENVANLLFNKTPVIYSESKYEGVAIRLRQQINENSKMLCWHHKIPEMNHNELLGWRTNTDNLAVVLLRNENDYDRNRIRFNINKEVIENYTSDIIEIWSNSKTLIQSAFFHIHIGDWISWYLSKLNKVDAIEIDVINFLKNELAKFK